MMLDFKSGLVVVIREQPEKSLPRTAPSVLTSLGRLLPQTMSQRAREFDCEGELGRQVVRRSCQVSFDRECEEQQPCMASSRSYKYAFRSACDASSLNDKNSRCPQPRPPQKQFSYVSSSLISSVERSQGYGIQRSLSAPARAETVLVLPIQTA